MNTAAGHSRSCSHPFCDWKHILNLRPHFPAQEENWSVLCYQPACFTFSQNVHIRGPDCRIIPNMCQFMHTLPSLQCQQQPAACQSCSRSFNTGTWKSKQRLEIWRHCLGPWVSALGRMDGQQWVSQTRRNMPEHPELVQDSAGLSSLSSQFSVNGPHGHLHASANAELPGRTGAGRGARAKPC